MQEHFCTFVAFSYFLSHGDLVTLALTSQSINDVRAHDECAHFGSHASGKKTTINKVLIISYM